MTDHGSATGAFDIHIQCFPWPNNETQRSKGVFFLFKQLWRVYPQWTKWEKKRIKLSPVKRNHYIFKNFDLYIRK